MHGQQQSISYCLVWKKSSRRDYSKVSGKLELPNLVEIQTDSFKWFTQQGIQEVFEEIYQLKTMEKTFA